MTFLKDIQFRPIASWKMPGSNTLGLALGQGQSPLEVVVTESATQPAVTAMRTAWKDRQAGRATPVLLVAIYGNHTAICGPSGDNPPVLTNVELNQAERLCITALSEPDRHSALRFLRTALEAIDSPMAGVRNEGLLSTHEIGVWLKERRAITDVKTKSTTVLTKTGQQLVMALGFEVSPLPGPASVLVSHSQKLALAVFLDRNESPESANQRFSNFSPVTYALTKADQENLPYVIIANGPALRIYPTNPGVGVGRRGRTETFLELHLDLLKEDHIPLVWYLFSADALSADGTFEKLLGDSKDYATSLGERLRERVYHDAIPQLATALVTAQDLKSPTQHDLDSTYHMALTLLFRILFIAYGEDKDLLPYRTNDLYRARSLKQKARDIIRIREEGTEFDNNSFSHWDDATRLFDAVNGGSKELGVPEYNGGLFSTDPKVSPTGAALSGLKLANDAFGPVLRYILVDESEEDFGPVDFRSLGVREFGTIYEGLLESELSVADTDLTVDSQGIYKPSNGAETHIKSGDVYIHNQSGARKSSGSYFTKGFAVEHLLNYSLEPALAEHTTRLSSLDEIEAGKAFFDFKVADIAMGSGHFLVAAVDRIERRLQQYLAERPLPAVTDELARLRNSAVVALGPLADGIDIEDTTLLRRQIARRCIYGVDLNPVAVELARVSLWIHTFVPGLPLSTLGHHLVEGNSLVGIGTLGEAREIVSKATGGPLFNVFVENIVQTAAQSVAKIGELSDADTAEIKAARGALEESRLNIGPIKAIFDILTASRLDPDIAGQIISNISNWQNNPDSIEGSNLHQNAVSAMSEISPFHFPVAFPDVFARERSGFDVILGNPPWVEAILEEDDFWTRISPGLQGYSQGEQENIKEKLRKDRPELVFKYQQELETNALIRKTLLSGNFPGMGTGDPDLYKAFSWRFWNLVNSNGGFIGVVMPAGIWRALGSTEFRKTVFYNSVIKDLTELVNRGKWAFDNVHGQYTIFLNCLTKRDPIKGSHIPIKGPFYNYSNFIAGVSEPPTLIAVEELTDWNDTMALPSMQTPESLILFKHLLTFPKFNLDEKGTWRARPHSEIHATKDRGLVLFSEQPPSDYWPVFKGESFCNMPRGKTSIYDIWVSDRGVDHYFGWVNPDQIKLFLQEKRINQNTISSSPMAEFPAEWAENPKSLPCLHPRVVFRANGRATDTRTILAALAPPNVILTNKASYLLWPRGDEKDQAYLLGILCSLTLDWCARRMVLKDLNFHIINSLPIPRPKRNNPYWQRVVEISGRLSAYDERYSEWADKVEVAWGPLDREEKDDMVDELDAIVAHLYGLTESQLIHIFETFHLGWDNTDSSRGRRPTFRASLENTVIHYQRWTPSH